jgi:alpha-beta hydrolase superfamily lysophospholipase
MDKKSIQETINIPSINRKIVIYKYRICSKKILVHGWSGSGNKFCVIAKELINMGFNVISFDAPANGKAT